ncbi:YhgE/Pip family protein [Nocardia sp. NBC_01503]|uniref:YhgE/Pip family protein n=1 Tax=Nocardia sp. NBC_01503 TaxID=2975997 RepID=UPI002E7BEEA0|nr:YhgE/Pip family protein [Nocardia sp. NBC_01503]WTL30079.1 YhgE/Pip family protein [Nocardia sp. NBC_01503]
MADKSKSLPARIGAKIRRPTGAKLTQSLIVLVLVVPTLVSAVYMWIMWDPELYLKHVPVAIATDDTGAVTDGRTQNMGAEILDNLATGGELEFHRVSSAEADRGLRENRYAFAVVIPADFTRNVLTVTDPQPKQARISVLYNDFNGTLGPAVANSVIAEAQREITKTIGRGYAGQILVGVNSLGSGLGDAAQGTTQLALGVGQLADGSGQLTAGLHSAATGAAQLATGTADLHTGATQLAAGAGELVTGTNQLGTGAVQIRDGVDQILTPLLDLAKPAGTLADSLEPLLERLQADPATADAATQLKSLLDQLSSTNPDSLVGQLNQLHDGTAELARQLTDPKADYLSGVLALAEGTGQLRDGATQLATGAGELSTGLGQLDEGGRQLQDGVTQLGDGVNQLNGGLHDGAAAAPHIANTDSSANMFAEPVIMDIHNQEPSQIVRDGDRSHKEIAGGAGPVIVVMGAFLAAIVLWMLVRPLRGRESGSRWRRAARPVLRGSGIGLACGIAAAAAAAVYASSIGWAPHQWPAMAAVVALVGITAALTTQLFVVLFGRVPGSIAAFAFFMFQTFAFGGVFPSGTTPSAFKPFEVIAPMTYARRAVVRADIALYDQMFWVSILMLLLMISGSVALMIGLRHARNQLTDQSLGTEELVPQPF